MSILRGTATGAASGGLVAALAWALVAFVALISLVFLGICMGAANAMSVNNVSTSQLLRDIPQVWWDLAGVRWRGRWAARS